MADERRFRAVLERDSQSLGWTVARVPFDARAVWPVMLRPRVCGSITGPSGSEAFRTSLFPEPEALRQHGYFLLVNRAMQQAAGVALGAMADFVLRADLAKRPAMLPEELDALLDEVEGLRAWYGELTEYVRREIGKWVGQERRSEAAPGAADGGTAAEHDGSRGRASASDRAGIS